MDLKFECIFEGRRIYQVMSGARALFTGTMSQCQRFMDIHEAKVCRSRNRSRRAPAEPASSS